MKYRVAVAALAATLGAQRPLNASTAPAQLTVVAENAFVRQVLNLQVPLTGPGTGTLVWNEQEGPNQEPRHSAIRLSSDETKRLRALLETASLFSGQFWGKEVHSFVEQRVTLTITTDGKVATLACSGNDSFRSGPRKQLLDLLMAILWKPRPTPEPMSN
jgi:hypothetical protein